jgi:hypothetical protein
VSTRRQAKCVSSAPLRLCVETAIAGAGAFRNLQQFQSPDQILLEALSTVRDKANNLMTELGAGGTSSNRKSGRTSKNAADCGAKALGRAEEEGRRLEARLADFQVSHDSR